MEGSPEGRVPLAPAAQARGAGAEPRQVQGRALAPAAQARENETESENVAKDDETAAAFFLCAGREGKILPRKKGIVLYTAARRVL